MCQKLERTMEEKITKRILDNGLTVLLKEMHTAPIISHWVWYRVGSRNEVSGKTGISHWVEHMQFKGTETYPEAMLDREISRNGGFWNAFTYLDWTAFYETMPADRIQLAIDLEADRMVNAIYDPEEVESERTVIISEREGNENDPAFRLNEAIHQTAFPVHPYRNEVIGNPEDLLRITRDDLYQHYSSHYVPNNAVLTVAGDFETDDMLRRIEKAYRNVPAGKVPEYRIEPAGIIEKPETVTVNGPAAVTLVRLNWRAPAGKDPDIFPLTILDSVLSGPSSLNMFGKGSISNGTSRMYRALVERGLAVSVGGGFVTTIDPYLFETAAYANPGVTPEEITGVIHQEIDRIIREGIRPDELEKARKQAKAMFIYSGENIANQAYWLGYTSMFDKPEWYADYLNRLNRVTAEDVSCLAEHYFRPEHCVTGIYSGYQEADR